MMPSLLVGRYMFRRMRRDLPSLLILLALPLVLIPILGAVFSWVPADIPYMRGVSSPMAFFAFGILIMFQLYGGNYSLSYVRKALLDPMGWRLRGLPCGTAPVILGVVGAATLMCLLQGLLVVAVSALVLGVRWGSLPLVVLTLLSLGLLSQLVYLCLLLGLGKPEVATSLGWLYGYGSCILGGLIFPLPVEQPFFQFLVTYGGPYSLAQTALRQAGPGGSLGRAALCVGILLGSAALLGILAAYLGRRRLS